MSHTLLSNKALKRLARSQEALSSSTTTSESAVYRKPIQHPPPNNCHSILKQRSNPHFSVELENIRQHRILNIRPRELEAMMSDMLLDSPGSPTKSGGLHVRLSSLNQTLPNNNQPTSEDEELVVPLPAKKKRRNRKKSSDLFLQQHQQQKALGCAQTAAVGLHKAIGSQQLLLSTN